MRMWILMLCLLYSTNAFSATLELSIEGAGGGFVNGAISCTYDSTCAPVSLTDGAFAVLIASPDATSTFAGWGGACQGQTFSFCFLTMDSDKKAVAIFNGVPKVSVGTRPFSSLQAAYDDPLTTSGATLRLLEGYLPGNFTANRNIAITIEGGYGAATQTISTQTTIPAPFLIWSGTVTINGPITVKPRTISVYKSLGSVQCTGGGTTPTALQTPLLNAGIEVISTSCGNDGLTYPTVCGASDGRIGIFEIPPHHEDEALALGYPPLPLTAHRSATCR